MPSPQLRPQVLRLNMQKSSIAAVTVIVPEAEQLLHEVRIALCRHVSNQHIPLGGSRLQEVLLSPGVGWRWQVKRWGIHQGALR